MYFQQKVLWKLKGTDRDLEMVGRRREIEKSLYKYDTRHLHVRTMLLEIREMDFSPVKHFGVGEKSLSYFNLFKRNT